MRISPHPSEESTGSPSSLRSKGQMRGRQYKRLDWGWEGVRRTYSYIRTRDTGIGPLPCLKWKYLWGEFIWPTAGPGDNRGLQKSVLSGAKGYRLGGYAIVLIAVVQQRYKKARGQANPDRPRPLVYKPFVYLDGVLLCQTNLFTSQCNSSVVRQDTSL